MTWFFASGHAADLALVALVIEAAWLLRRGRDARDVAAALLPGAFLMLALRGALTGAAWPWIAAPLAVSFVAHLDDLSRRHPRG